MNIHVHLCATLTLFAGASAWYGISVPSTRPLPCTERLLATVPATTHDTYWSNDWRHVAFVVKVADKQYVEIDGKRGPKYDDIAYNRSRPIFSPDNARTAYSARKGDKWVVVVDGREGPAYTDIPHIWFTSDSRHLVYLAHKGPKVVQVIDGREGPEYAGTGTVNICVLSPDMSRVAYVVRDDRKTYVVLDGKPCTPCDEIMWLQFSPDNQRLGYVVRNAKQLTMVMDGHAGPVFDEISLAKLFSPDSKRFAYWGMKDRKFYMVVDGKPSVAYDMVGEPLFNMDGTRVVYTAENKGRNFVVIDGKEGSQYENVGNLVFSPDGRHVAYTAGNRGDCVMILDDNAGPVYRKIDRLVFSPDSSKLAYIARGFDSHTMRTTHAVIVNDKIVATYDSQYEDIKGLTFSPDSKRLAYTMGLHEARPDINPPKRAIVVDGGVILECFGVNEYSVTFSPDSRHWLYKSDFPPMIRNGKKYPVMLFIDGQYEIKRDDVVLDEPHFTTDGLLEFTIFRENAYYRVSYTLPAGSQASRSKE